MARPDGPKSTNSKLLTLHLPEVRAFFIGILYIVFRNLCQIYGT